MITRTLARWGRLAVLASATTLAVALALFASSGQSAAHAPHPGLNFWIEAVGQSGCDTSAGDASCFIDPGTTFAADVHLDPLPTDIPGYEGYDIVINYTGVTSLDNARTQEREPGVPLWPECEFPAAAYQPGVVAMACALGITNTTSTYSGVIGTNDFTCTQSGTITLVSGSGNTALGATGAILHDEGEIVETLDITCAGAPTATVPAPSATATSVPPTATVGALGGAGTGGPGGSDAGGGAGLWLLIAALAVAAATGLSVASWRFARR